MVGAVSPPLDAPPDAAARRRKRARIWWMVHQWAGLKFSILLSFVLFTGTLATLSSEMDWLMRPALRVSAAAPVDWTAIARNVEARYPDDLIAYIEAPVASAFAAQVLVERPDGSTGFVYAHPATGAVQGEGSTIGAQRVLRNMHRRLDLPVWIGVPIVSALSLLLLVSLVTSLIVYKKWWRGWLKRVRTRDARTGWGDFHRLAGVWSLWFVLLMIVTGLWYLVEETIAPAPPLPAPTAAVEPIKPFAMAERLQASLAAARAADPGLRLRLIQFPSEDEPTFVLQGQRRAWLVRPRANAVWTAADDGSVLLVTDASALSLHQRIGEAADPLHFGTWGAYPTKILWFLFGLLLTGLSVSGTALYAMRIGGAQREKESRRTLIGRAWSGMGPWRWPAAGLVVAAFIMLPGLFAAED